MERITTRLKNWHNQKDHFYSTPEYVKHKYMFDFYKKQRTDLCNFVGFRDNCPISLDFWEWYLMVTEEFERYYKLDQEQLTLLKYNDKIFLNYEEDYIIKNITQAEYKFGIEYCIIRWGNELIKSRKKVFSFLDSVENPYKHIFYPIWEINTYAHEKGYYPYQVKGVNKITTFVATEYAKYKVSQKINVH